MSISLNSSVRTCNVNVGEAQRIESDRFLNPNNMVCIPWNGYNSKGQKICPDSWNTKSAGCNSAMDRVSVENSVSRPQYISYINLNAAGIDGDIYKNTAAWTDSGAANAWSDSRNQLTGQYGNQWAATNIGSCSLNAYEKAMAQSQQAARTHSAASTAYQQNAYRQQGGN
jgi:hypothetical protein